MDVKAIYSSIKNKKGEKLPIDSFDVNVTDIDGNSLLHVAAISKDVETSKQLMNKGAVYNIKNKEGKKPLHVANGAEMKHLYRNVRMFFKVVKKGNIDKVSKYILNEKFLVNVKEENAGTALHWAVGNNNNDIVKLLLENGADVLQLTNKGNTALHTAVFTGNAKTVELLLREVPEDMLFKFINFQTFETKSTGLHFSAEDGYFDIIKILLKYGAIYNIKNKKGDIPCNLAKNSVINTFLKLIHKLFSRAKNGDPKPFTELYRMNISELEAVTNVRDISNNTILHVLESCGHSDLADTVRKTFTEKDRNLPEWSLNELEILEYRANVHRGCSKTYAELLNAYTRSSISGKNTCPWKTLKEGSYLLGNAHRLVSDYKTIRPGPIEDTNIKIIDDTLQKLQFDPSHISSGYTMEAYEGEAKCFVSKAEGTEYYYKLLHSDSVKDVRFFLEMVEKRINAPVESFLETLNEKFLFFPSIRLKTVIENNRESEVLKCIERGADVNYVYDSGETPLMCAVKCDSMESLQILLERGADIYKISNDGNSILHIAVSITSGFNYSKSNNPLKLSQLLLKYGAKYNCKNKEGKTPLDVSKFTNTTALLQQIDDCFTFAKNDNPEIVRQLQAMEIDEFQAIAQSRNADGYTLLQLAICRDHKSIERALLDILKEEKDIRSINAAENIFDRKLNKIINLTEKYTESSKIHLSELKELANESDSEINFSPWKALMEGSFYLLNAYNLVNEYKNTLPIFPADDNIEKINDTLNQLQFHSKHIDSSYVDEKANVECFVSKAGVAEFYYRLLSSKYKKDIRHFIEITEENIDIPTRMFSETGILNLYRMKQCAVL